MLFRSRIARQGRSSVGCRFHDGKRRRWQPCDSTCADTSGARSITTALEEFAVFAAEGQAGKRLSRIRWHAGIPSGVVCRGGGSSHDSLATSHLASSTPCPRRLGDIRANEYAALCEHTDPFKRAGFTRSVGKCSPSPTAPRYTVSERFLVRFVAQLNRNARNRGRIVA